MARLHYTDFDVDVQLVLKKMIKLANERWKNRSWFIDATFWNDTDYRLKLISSWEMQDIM